MNRTDRLYALVEELRASAPRRRSARELAARYEISVRTIERDIGALQQAGVPIYADVGRRGGYTLDKTRTLPPLNFTPEEAVAVAVALGRAADGSPFSTATRGALRKIVAAMPEHEAAAARDLAARIRLLHPDEPAGERPRSIAQVIERGIVRGRVLRIAYEDRDGQLSERDVEPIVFLHGPRGYWYLVAWCRLRADTRAFRIDRVQRAELTDLPAPDRPYEAYAPSIPNLVARPPEFA